MGGEGEPDDAHALHSSRRKLHVLKTIINGRDGRVRLLINEENNVCQSFWLSQQLEQIAR